jgi:hypothetical protein
MRNRQLENSKMLTRHLQKLKPMCREQRTRNTDKKTHQQVVFPCKSSQGSVLPLILLDVFLLQSLEVWSPLLVDVEWAEGIRGFPIY